MATMATAELKPSPRWRRARNVFSGYALILPALLLVGLIIVYPATRSIIVTLTTQADGSPAAFTLDQYTSFFTDTLSTTNLLYTLRVALEVVAILFLIAFPICLYLRFSKSRIANVIHFLTLFPLFVPGIVLAYALIRFTITHGMLASILAALCINNYTTPYLTTQGIMFGLVWEGIPFTTLILNAALIQIDDALIDSARDVGANAWQIFTRIMLPLIKDAVVIIFALQFLMILGSYTIPYLMGPAEPEMMGVFMQRTYQDVQNPVQAQTQAVVTFVIAALAGYVYVRTVASQQKGQE